MAYTGAGDRVTTAKRRSPGGELTLTERTMNRGSVRGPGTRRTRHGTAEVLADPPQVLRQPQPHTGAEHLFFSCCIPGREGPLAPSA